MHIRTTMTQAPHPLRGIFDEVLQQVEHGKGARHGGTTKPFWAQTWAMVAQTHGVGFLTGQAQKKLMEAMLSGNRVAHSEAFERELLGAIAYLGMAILYARRIDTCVTRIVRTRKP